MPPRARKSAAPKPKKEAPVTDPQTPEELVEAVQEAATEHVEEVIRNKPGRKKSDLAEAAREFEKWTRVTDILLDRYEKWAEKLAAVQADLNEATTRRDEAKAKLDAALNG